MPARLLKAGLTFLATLFVIAMMGATVMMASGTGPVARSRKLIERGVSYELAQMREALVEMGAGAGKTCSFHHHTRFARRFRHWRGGSSFQPRKKD